MTKRVSITVAWFLAIFVLFSGSIDANSLHPLTVSAQEPADQNDNQDGDEIETQEFNPLAKVICPSCPAWSPNVKLASTYVHTSTPNVCSGVLVDPKHLLTAGHCIFSHELPSGVDQWPISIEVVPAYDNANRPYGDSLASDWFVFPEWQNKDFTIPGPIPDQPDYNWDIGIIELARPVGALTGWYRIGYNPKDSFFKTNNFDNPGYPSDPDYNYNGEHLYNWSGNFDCVTDNNLYQDADSRSIGGHSGGGILFSTEDITKVYGVLSGPYIEVTDLNCLLGSSERRARYTRITQSKYNDFQNFMISNTPIIPDLIPLNVNVSSSTIAAGNQIPSIDFLLHNYSSATWNGTIPIKIYLSTDDNITDSDTLLGTVSHTGQVGPKESDRVTLNNLPKIPANKKGRYWIGIKLHLQDVDPGNNTTQGWDAQEITVTNPNPNQTENVSVALIIDATGSMRDNDPNGMRKAAAKVFIDSAQIGDKIAVVAFNTNKYHYGPLRTIQTKADRDALKAAVDKVGAYSGTDINVGLQGGFDELSSDTSDNAKTAVLLTDGKNEPAKDTVKHLLYKNKGWPIYTVGLGEAIIDEIRKIATETGGECVNNCTILQDPNQLQPLYFDILQKVAGGNTVFNQSVPVPQGASESLTTSVPPNQNSATFFSGWSGTLVSMDLVSPTGRRITSSSSASDVYHAVGSTYRIYTIQQPEAGTWKIEVSRSGSSNSASILTEGNQVDIRVAVRKKPDPFMVYLPVALRNHKPGTSQPPPTPTPPPPNRGPNKPSSPVPAANASDTIVTTKLFWSGGDPDSGDTVTYKVYFDANKSNPTTLLCNNTVASLCDPPGNLQYDTDYYWKVVATDNHNATSTGSVWHFKTEPAPSTCDKPGKSTLSLPGDKTTVTDNTPTFVWTSASDATEYYLQVDNNNDFSSPEISLLVNDTEYELTSELSDGTYYWRVIGNNHTDQCNTFGLWSDIWLVNIQTGPIWSPPVNLSKASGSSENPDIVISPSRHVHIVWNDNVFGSHEIYYTMKLIGLNRFTPIVNVSNQTGDDKFPSIGTDATNTLHLVWSNDSILYSQKDLEGDWLNPETIGVGFKPKVAVGSDGSVHIVWETEREIYYSVKTNNGSWSTPFNLSNSANLISYDPDIALDSQNRPHIVWDEQVTSYSDIYYVSQADNGTWLSPENISKTTIDSHFGKVKIDLNDTVHVIWPNADGSGVTTKMTYSYKTTSGVWSNPMPLFNDQFSYLPKLAVSPDNELRLVWSNLVDTFFSKQFNGSWLTPLNISNNSTTGLMTELDSNGGIDALVWMDDAPGNLDIFYSEAVDNVVWSTSTSLSSIESAPDAYPVPTPTPSLR